MSRAAKSSRGEAEQAEVAKPRRIFGLSIDERIRWAAPNLSPTIQSGIFDWAAVKSSDKGEWVLPDNQDVKIHDWLRANLEALKLNKKEMFENVTAIGVSCIGIIIEDQGVNQLARVYRKPRWLAREDGCIINFNKLFEGLFVIDGGKKLESSLTVRNDATAKGLTEIAASPDKKYPFVFINLHVGMNCGIVVDYGKHAQKEGDVFRTALHPEFGHCRPVRHPDDRFVDPAHSGCPVHTDCYEALASGGRFRARWGSFELPDNHEQWEFVAYYIAQACFTITMLLAPATISIGGYLARDFLIENIKDKFDELNRFYIPNLNPDFFIRRASVDSDYFDILGALQVALANPWLERGVDHTNVKHIEEARRFVGQHRGRRQ